MTGAALVTSALTLGVYAIVSGSAFALTAMLTAATVLYPGRIAEPPTSR